MAGVEAAEDPSSEDELTFFDFFKVFFVSVSRVGGASSPRIFGHVRLLWPGWWQILHFRCIL